MPYNISIWNQFECSLRVPRQAFDDLFSIMHNEFNRNGIGEDEDEDQDEDWGEDEDELPQESNGREFIYHRPVIEGNVFRMYLAGEWKDALVGTLDGDTVVIQKINICSEWGATCFRYMMDHLFNRSTGIYKAVLIWEDGDSIERFEVQDGVVTEEEIDIVNLIIEHDRLKKMVEEGQ